MAGPGVRGARMRIGRPIALGDGLGKIGMAGPGSATIRGAGRHITTAAGIGNRDMDGAGIRARLDRGITGRPGRGGFLDGATAEASVWVSAISAGCRWRRMSLFIAGGGAAIMAEAGSTV